MKCTLTKVAPSRDIAKDNVLHVPGHFHGPMSRHNQFPIKVLRRTGVYYSVTRDPFGHKVITFRIDWTRRAQNFVTSLMTGDNDEVWPGVYDCVDPRFLKYGYVISTKMIHLRFGNNWQSLSQDGILHSNPHSKLLSDSHYSIESSDSNRLNPNYSHGFGISSDTNPLPDERGHSVGDGQLSRQIWLSTCLLSTTASPSGSSVHFVSGNSNITSFSATLSLVKFTASATVSSQTSRSVTSASRSSTSATTHIISELLGERGVVTSMA